MGVATRMEALNKHLWEFDHPYYCNEGCYYVAGPKWSEVHADWASWADFFEDWGSVDPDYNLLFRWDWKVSDPADYAEEIRLDADFALPSDTLQLFFFLQRKAKPFSHFISVTSGDEAAVREWLAVKAQHMRLLWEPLLDAEEVSA